MNAGDNALSVILMRSHELSVLVKEQGEGLRMKNTYRYQDNDKPSYENRDISYYRESGISIYENSDSLCYRDSDISSY